MSTTFVQVGDDSTRSLLKRLEGAFKDAPTAMRKSRSIGASGLGDCLRQQGYSILGVPPSNAVGKSDWEIAARQGDTIHDHIQIWSALAGLTIDLPGHQLSDRLAALYVQYGGVLRPDRAPALEVRLPDFCDPVLKADLDQRMLSGRIDAIWRLEDDSLAVMDLKTCKSADFEYESPYAADKERKWAAQLGVYRHYFMTPDGERIRHALIWKIDRGDTGRRVLLRMRPDDDVTAINLERADQAAHRIRKGELPEPEPSYGPCALCRWKKLCPATAEEKKGARR